VFILVLREGYLRGQLIRLRRHRFVVATLRFVVGDAVIDKRYWRSISKVVYSGLRLETTSDGDDLLARGDISNR
jgi:hypothetical protein